MSSAELDSQQRSNTGDLDEHRYYAYLGCRNMLSLIAVVRHGESEGNVANVGHGRSVSSEFWSRHIGTWRLTDHGIAQARSAGEILSKSGLPRFDFYCVSPMMRALETAVNMALPGARWRVEPALAERAWGTELRKLEPLARRRWMEGARGEMATDPWGWAPPGGENLAGVQARLRALLCVLGAECPGGSALLVTHGEVISTLRAHMEGVRESGVPPGSMQGSILFYKLEANVWRRAILKHRVTDLDWIVVSPLKDDEMLAVEVLKHERHVR